MLSCQVDFRYHPTRQRWQFLRALTYRLADCIVFLDEGQAAWYARAYRGWNTQGIPNALTPIPADLPDYPVPGGMARNLVAMGRLVPQKGFDMLIEAFSCLAAEFPEWGLVILGEGPLRPALEAQVRSLELEGRIQMPGAIHPPFSILKKCDLFVFSSRYEGQGMALIEAMACGLPAVSFDCPSGPAHIVRHEVDGLLVPPEDTVALVRALQRLMADTCLRHALAVHAAEVAARFDRDALVEQWGRLFEEVRNRRAGRP